MNRQTFKQSESNRVFLQGFLDHPVVTLALSIVKQECSPSIPVAIPGVDYSAQMAVAGAKAAGAAEFLNLLQSLCDEPRTNKVELFDSHAIQAIEKMVQSGQYTQEEAQKHYEESLTQP